MTRIWTFATLGAVLSLGGTASAQFTINDLFGAPRRQQQRPYYPSNQTFQQERPQVQTPLNMTAEEIAKSKDPRIYCSTFTRKPVKVDGVSQERFVVSDPKYLRCLPPQPSTPWVVTKDRWDDLDEINWQSFVKAIGESKCSTLDTCLASSANPYRDEADIRGTHYADCADFPMYMRAYFAYKNKLPFSVVHGFQPNELTYEQEESVQRRRLKAEEEGKLEEFEKNARDIRYSLNGNRPTSRYNIPHTVPAQRDFFKAANTIANVISSGTYRMFHTSGSVQPDFYSPMITRESIRPGTVLYKVTGHVALVYDVTEEGDVKYVDAHPDNSITRGTFSREYVRSNPFQGGGFKNWRPFIFTGRKAADGTYKSGRFNFQTDHQIRDYSAEQYYGTQPTPDWNWQEGKFILNGLDLNMFDYVERRLAAPNYRAEPVKLFYKRLMALCTDLQERTTSVQTAINANIHRRAHPANLPSNIYGADGEWESYSTPGRDLRIRKRALDVIDDAKEYLKRIAARDPFYFYDGTNLKKDFIKIYHEVDANCRISYTNSERREIRMSLTTALARVTKMSFDPYFCPERRWGAQTQAEMRSCVESADKAQWYEFTQFLRNRVVRDPTETMGWSLGDVERLQRRQSLDANEQTSRFNILRALQGL